jgi:hypothetical protein
MVKSLSACAFALGAIGCLGKPPFPLTDAAVDPDAQDATLMPDAAPGCAGRMTFPADLKLRRLSEVGDIDRRDNGTGDDVVVIGRVGNGIGQAFAYLMQGHPGLTGQCYDRSYPLQQTHDNEPIDMWLGDASGDGLPDLLLMGRETDRNPTEIELVLYAGDASRQPATKKVLNFPLSTPFQNEWGGTVTSPEPAYLVVWGRSAPAPLRHVFAGGLYYDPATISLTQPPLAFGSVLGARPPPPGDTNPITFQAVQEAHVHAVGDPQEVVMLVQDAVFRLRKMDDGTGRSYETGGSTPVGTPGQRYARFARRPVDIGGVMTTIGATQRSPFGYFIMRVDGPFSKAPTVQDFLTGPDPSGSIGIAIAFVDADPAPDFIGLTIDDMDVVLQVSPNLDFTLPSVRADSLVELRLTGAATDDYGILAVGDFDGVASTPDQLLVMSSSPGTHPAKCFQLTAGALVPCT